MIAYGAGLSISAELSYDLGTQSAIDGGGGDTLENGHWISNDGQYMRDNLGNALYFNTNQAA